MISWDFMGKSSTERPQTRDMTDMGVSIGLSPWLDGFDGKSK